MSTKKLFNKPFDDGTIAKLLIFENYLNSWLPTFILASGNKPIQIFDLFAGAGYDSEKTEGSPLRSLRIINKFKDLLNNFNKSVYMYLNDTNSTNISNLKIICKNKINEYGLEDIVKPTYSEIPFNTFITKHNSILNNGCNLIFADQYGLKEINENVFKTLINFPFTDFIFFISSSVLHRFPDEPEIKKHHPKFDFDKIRNCDQKNIHNVVCQEYRKYLPSNDEDYWVIPYSIMKSNNNNIYGLIFVSKHIRGADKFLDITWKMNETNGSANFDIKEEFKKSQLHLFNEPLPSQIEAFKKSLEELIFRKKLITNKEIYIYTLRQGHIPRHAKDKLVEMKNNKLIDFGKYSPWISYDKIFNENKIKEIRVL